MNIYVETGFDNLSIYSEIYFQYLITSC